MIKHNQNGGINVLLIPLILACLLLIAAAGFGYWAYGSRQDYKNNTDQKIQLAVAVAVQKEDTKKDAEFVQEAKQPLTTYTGPQAYGSVKIQCPKNWSSYVDASSNSQNLVNGYFDPGTVPSINDTTNNFALRFEVINQSYSTVLQNLTDQQQQQGANLTFSPYSLPKVPSAVGVRVEGQVQPNKNGSMIVLPLRSTTLEVWTEAQAYENDFNNNILPNLTFSP